MKNKVKKVEEKPATKPIAKCKLLSPAKKEKLFNQYIMPNIRDVRSLVRVYTNNYQDEDDNYSICLAQLYNYIGTYNPEQKLSTWIHIVVKRACNLQNQKRSEENSRRTDIEMCSMNDLYGNEDNIVAEPCFDSLIHNISDEMFHALLKIPPQRLSPFLLFAQGLKIRDIVAIEWEKGNLQKKNEDVVKSRIYWVQRQMRMFLKGHR